MRNIDKEETFKVGDIVVAFGAEWPVKARIEAVDEKRKIYNIGGCWLSADMLKHYTPADNHYWR